MTRQALLYNIKKLIQPIHRRLLWLLSFGKINEVDDAKSRQSLQLTLLNHELCDQIERFQEYGLTSHPHPEAECLIGCLSGSRDHPIAFSVDDKRYRLKNLAQGEVAIYTDEGDFIHLKRGNAMSIKTKTLSIKAESVAIDAKNVSATGDIKDKGKTMNEMRQIFDNHTHSNEGASPPNSKMNG